MEQDIRQAMTETVGAQGVPALALEAALVRAEKGLEQLREQAAQKSLPLLAMPFETSDLEGIEDAAQALREGASDVVILGTGGSSLGGQTLAQLGFHHVAGVTPKGPKLHFLDNLDPVSFQKMLVSLPLQSTRFAAISKSGGTGETLMQSMAVVSALKEQGLKPSHHMLGLSEPVKPQGRNGLRALLEAEDVRFHEHYTGIGGRYSVLTNVGLLPAAILGLDIRAIRTGAARALQPVLDGGKASDVPSALGAALNVAMMMEGKMIAVLMPYADRLERLTRWWVQLWAESLGKTGHGSQPVAALGPVDQHSQLQLYLAGPNDKLFTVMTVECAGLGPRMDKSLAERAGEPGLAAKTIGDLVAAQGRATADTLARNGRPVRTIHLEKLDEAVMGELLMHFMLETILAGYALGIDPFDQPAVEEGKILAKQYLAGQG